MRHRTAIRILVLLALCSLQWGSAVYAQAFCAPPKPVPEQEPPDKPAPACERCKTNCTGSPCYVSSGIYTTDATDLEIPTPGFPLSVYRRYRSDRVVDGPLGLGWMTSLTARIYSVAYFYSAPNTYAYRAVVMLPGGSDLDFTQDANGAFIPPPTSRHSLVRNPDSTWTFTPERTRTSLRFNADGTISAVVDEFGNTLSFTYANGRVQRVSDSAGSGRYVDVTWGPDGRISMVSDSYSPARQVKYYYDSTTGALTGVADAAVSSDPQQRSTKYTYVAGRFGPLISRIADQWDRVISDLTWYPNDQLKSYTDGAYNNANPSASEGEKYTYSYFPTALTPSTSRMDSVGSVVHNYDANGLITDHAVYDGAGLPSRLYDAWGNHTDFTYDSRGNVLTRSVSTSGNGFVAAWTYTYDATYPDQVATIQPQNPLLWPGWRYQYVAAGQPGAGALSTVKRFRTDGITEDVVASYTYDGKGQVLTATSSGANTLTYIYNAAGEVIEFHDELGNVTTYGYDSVGRLTSMTRPGNRTTTYAYDSRNRLVSVTLPKPTPTSPNFTTVMDYDHYDAASGLTYSTSTDPNGRTKQVWMDALANTRRVVDTAGHTTTYDYQYNLLKTVRDANGNATSYGYDAHRQLASTTYPDGNVEQYTRTEDGLVTAKTSRNGVISNYSYDALGRLTDITYPGRFWPNGSFYGITWTYSGGLVTTITDQMRPNAEFTTYTYDASFRVLTDEKINGPKITYAYAQQGTVALPLTYRVDPPAGSSEPSQTVTYGYGPGGRVSTIGWSHIPGVFGFTYTAEGDYDTITYPNGQARQFLYDNQNRLTSVINNHPTAGTIARYDYGYDIDWTTGSSTMLGQRTSMSVTAPVGSHQELGTTKYYYDAAYQLSRVEYGVGGFEQFQYDAIGNRTEYRNNFITQPYTYYRYPGNLNANSNRLKNAGGVADLVYDANGNVTSTGTALTWDFANRLTGYGASTIYSYDFARRRVQRVDGANTTKYVFHGIDAVAERGAGVQNDYLFAPGVDQPLAKRDAAGNITYYSADGIGSIVAENDPAGGSLLDTSYAAFGTPRSGTGPAPFSYTAREPGPPGLYYRARYYDSVTGRFLSEDPLQGLLGLTGADPYAYVFNSPQMFTDPTGWVCQMAAHVGPWVQTKQTWDQRWFIRGTQTYSQAGANNAPPKVDRNVPANQYPKGGVPIIPEICWWEKMLKVTDYYSRKVLLDRTCTCPDSYEVISDTQETKSDSWLYKSPDPKYLQTVGFLIAGVMAPCPNPNDAGF